MVSRFEWVASKVRGKKILDIGFAEKTDNGLLVHEVIRKANSSSLIVPLDIVNDLSKPGFENAVQGNVFNLPFKDNCFDCVSFLEVLEHLWNPKDAVEEICRVLSPKGKLFITTPNPFDLIRVSRFVLRGKGNLGDGDHKFFLDKPSIENILSASGLNLVSFETVQLRMPKIRLEFSKNPFLFKFVGNYQCIIAQKEKKVKK